MIKLALKRKKDYYSETAMFSDKNLWVLAKDFLLNLSYFTTMIGKTVEKAIELNNLENNSLKSLICPR